VFLMRLDGRGVRQVTSGEWYDQRPALSPDGRRIAFISNRGGRPGIWMAEATEGAAAEPVAVEASAESVAWSLDGATLYFTHRVRDAFAVGAVAATGGEWRAVASDAAGELREPVAAPGGETLVVQARRDDAWTLAELRLDDGSLRLLSPPGFETSARGSRAVNGVVVFESNAPAGTAA
jgi:TolB protein